MSYEPLANRVYAILETARSTTAAARAYESMSPEDRATSIMPDSEIITLLMAVSKALMDVTLDLANALDQVAQQIDYEFPSTDGM